MHYDMVAIGRPRYIKFYCLCSIVSGLSHGEDRICGEFARRSSLMGDKGDIIVCQNCRKHGWMFSDAIVMSMFIAANVGFGCNVF
jgi:hypothetical protein